MRWLNYSGVIEGAEFLYDKSVMLLYGLAMLIGHCLPITNNFKGGRGIFTYSGYLLYFAPGPMIISLIVAGLITFIWKQVRFAQYVIVILPVLLTHIFTLLCLLLERIYPSFYRNYLGYCYYYGSA